MSTGSLVFGVEQAVQVNDEIAHMGIVDAGLCLGLPDGVRRLVIRIDADDVERVEVAEFGAAQLLECNSCFFPSSAAMSILHIS
jgi:hypothetical protein